MLNYQRVHDLTQFTILARSNYCCRQWTGLLGRYILTKSTAKTSESRGSYFLLQRLCFFFVSLSTFCLCVSVLSLVAQQRPTIWSRVRPVQGMIDPLLQRCHVLGAPTWSAAARLELQLSSQQPNSQGIVPAKPFPPQRGRCWGPRCGDEWSQNLRPSLRGWTSSCKLFWCSQGRFDILYICI